MKPIIKVENLSKQYRLGTIGTSTIKEDVQRWWHRIQGKEDPYLKIGDTNDRNTKGNSDYVWALKNINFEVMPGEILGVIGKNGAGKSTMLKILSKVTGPSTGSISYNGRIGSLLEVGTGFHPELTGRENIFLNGAILGMTKHEIRSKIDEIIDFSGCERYIDTPVKRYSSGMTVRLGFAIAAYLEPEILIVDEVLTVGDAEFQKRAIGKMQDVSYKAGRTILFVSHSMTAINDLCTRGILLANGEIFLDGSVKKIITAYNSIFDDSTSEKEWTEDNAPGNEFIKLKKAYAISPNYKNISYAYINQEIGFCIEYEVLKDTLAFTNGINVFNSLEAHLFTSHCDLKDEKNNKIIKGKYRSIVWIPSNLLQNDKIEFSFACMRYNPFKVLFHERKIIHINVLEAENSITKNEDYKGDLPGLLRPKLKWDKITKIN